MTARTAQPDGTTTQPATSQPKRLRPRDRDAILQSLRTGVVPRRGLQHIQVGRDAEIRAFLEDLERIRDNGAAVRFVIGEYGAGKSFFLQLVRSIALERNLVVASADLTPDIRLQASGGKARALYSTLMAQLATKTKQDGGAMVSVVERFVSTVLRDARQQNRSAQELFEDRVRQLTELPGGYDFTEVVRAYWQGHEEGQERLKSDAVRWLRAEFSTRTDARNALGVRSIIDDASIYEHLKLFARFVRLAGYSGLLVGLDEMVNLFKISHSGSRNANYEQILRIVNDALQGIAEGIGFVFCGTPPFLFDTRRGLYSYEALRSRLAANTFASRDLRDLSGPVIQLTALAQEDLFALLHLLQEVFFSTDRTIEPLDDDALHSFMEHCFKKLGAEFFQTPRNFTRAFLDLLAILEQNPASRWTDLIEKVDLEIDREVVPTHLPGLDDEGPMTAPHHPERPNGSHHDGSGEADESSEAGTNQQDVDDDPLATLDI